LEPRPEKAPHRDLRRLTAIARELRLLPRQKFRAALKSSLQRRASMSMREGSESSVAAVPARAVHYMRPGFTSITPYIIVNGASDLHEVSNNAFRAAASLRVPVPNGKMMQA